jgi:hypothetical protein
MGPPAAETDSNYDSHGSIDAPPRYGSTAVFLSLPVALDIQLSFLGAVVVLVNLGIEVL